MKIYNGGKVSMTFNGVEMGTFMAKDWQVQYQNNCPIQEALQSGAETIETLESKYHIHAKRHSFAPGKVLFKYDQIESDFSNPIVASARGIILDESDNWKII